MDFSKKYLLKYGWEEGQGLGKMKDGMKIAIKPKLKFDKAGMGYDPSVEFTDSWWIKVYNDALEDANVKKEEREKNERDDDKHKEKTKIKKRKFTEESFTDLFKACEGRTVHKGARQGLQLGGKLKRLEQQELQLLSKKENQRKNKNELKTVKSSTCFSEPIVDKEAEEEIRTSKKKKKDKLNNKKR